MERGFLIFFKRESVVERGCTQMRMGLKGWTSQVGKKATRILSRLQPISPDSIVLCV